MVITRLLFLILLFLVISPIMYSLTLTPVSPSGMSVINENSVLLSIFTNKYGSCSYSLDSGVFNIFPESEEVTATTPGGILVEGDAWLVSTSNHLELSEDGSTSDTVETLRNITTYIDKNNLKALASGSVTNNKVTSPFNQYFYLLGPGVEAGTNFADTGYVKYSENDDDVTADFLYFKSGREVGRYLLEFTTPFQSGIYDELGSSSTAGLFLTDYEDKDIIMMGKIYTIVTARRISAIGNNIVLTLLSGAGKDTLLEKQTKTYTISGKNYEVTLNFVDSDEAQFVVNGQATRKLKDGDTDKLADGTIVGVTDVLYQDYAGGIHSATFFIGADKIELKDDNIRDESFSNALKVNDNTIDDASVIVEGTDTNSTFKITRIHVNMTADDNFFVPAGGKLSDAIKQEGGASAEPEVLFTQNWDIEYKGLKKVNTEKIKLKTSGSSQYSLEFMDGSGNKVDLPVAKTTAASTVFMGDTGKYLKNTENKTIAKDDYFVVTDSTRKRGERKTYVLQYKGADKITADNPTLKFKNLGDSKTIEQTFSAPSTVTTPIATLKIGGADFRIFNATDVGSDMTASDFLIRVDMDASGALNGVENATVNITTRYGAEIGIFNTTRGLSTPHIILSVKTPDSLYDGNAKDSVENIRPTDFVVNITGDSNTKVAHAKLVGFTAGQRAQQITLRTPDGKTNIEYGYTTYGSFITRETPSSEPATFEIEYPESQRFPLVYITTKGMSFVDKETTTTRVNKNKWKVSSSTKKLDLSEDLVSGINREIMSNITTYIDKSNLRGLDSESITNSKGTSKYNQYLYVLGHSNEANMDQGYVIFTEDNRNITSDYLYFKSGKEIGRYLLEFVTPLESGIYNSSGLLSTKGIFLKDFDGIQLKLFGKNYTITNVSRTSIEGNGINITLISEFDKLELVDTSIRDITSSNYLKANDTYIDDAFVIIEGSDNNSTFKINRIHINMTADDNFYVPSGGSLSETIKVSGINSKPQVLFTENWDISYLGLGNASTQKIKLTNTSSNQYTLEFVDGDGNIVNFPISASPNGSQALLGNISQPFINRENLTIAKNSYFVLTDGSKKRGERKSFILQYSGADKITSENATIKFRNLGDNLNIIQSFTNSSPLTTIKIGDADYKIFAADDLIRANLTINDFDIRVDMDRSGTLNSDINSNVIITTSFGAEINITNQTNENSILLSIRTPDDGKESNAEDNIDTLYPTILVFNITANSGNITHTKLGNLNFRGSSGQNNVEYAYTSYGAYIKREFPIGFPPTFEIEYPSAQREALVYYENGGIQSKLLTNLTDGLHNISIRCSDIFENIFNDSLRFNYTKIPLILNVSPANNSYNVSVNSNIIINFRKKVDTSNLKFNIFIKDSDNNKVGSIFTYNNTINQTIFDPVNFLKFNTTYAVNVTKNVKDLYGNNLEDDYFWTFTTAQRDTDNDGVLDIEDNDIDNDGIDDEMDFFRGNLSNINSNFFNLSIMIDSDFNTSRHFNETKKIEFYRGDIKLLRFDFNFSNNSKLDLSNISILNASNSSLGGVIIKGIPLSASGFKKTAIVEKIDISMNGLCIKDEEIDWIDNISDACDSPNEYKAECDGTAQNGYTCFYNSTIDSYQVSGLSHSGAVQLSYTKPSSSSSSSSTSSSGGSSGGGGGGGGGGAAGFICNMDWKCSEWSECTNGLQARQCDFVKVAQHWQETQCPEESKPPTKSQACEVKIEAPTIQSANKTEVSFAHADFKAIGHELVNETQLKKSGLSAITGNAINRILNNSKAMAELKVTSLILSIMAASIFCYRRFSKLKA